MESSVETLALFHENAGMVPLYCQAWSMDLARKVLPKRSSGTIVQMGHWISTKKPYKRLAVFEGHEVSFVELLPESIDMLEMCEYSRTEETFWVGTKRVYGIAAVEPPKGAKWTSVPKNAWIPCRSYAFRMKKTKGHALVVHVRHETSIPFAYEHFADGSNTIWSHDITDLYVLSNAVEQKRKQRHVSEDLRAFITCTEPMREDKEHKEDQEDKEHNETILVSVHIPLTLDEILDHAVQI